MIRKAVFAAVALTVCAVALLGTDAGSYTRTIFNNAREAVRSEIDPNLKLDTIRDQVDNLMPEIRQHMKVVAEQVVDVRSLQAAIAEKQAQLASQRAAILALRSDLDSSRDEFRYRQVSYTRDEVEADLAERFDAFRLLEESLERDRKILQAQKQTLRANQKKLDSMMARRQELAVRLSQVEARLKQVEATETVHAIEVDDTALSHVEELLKDLNHELDVREAMLETEGHVLGRIPVEEDGVDPTASDILSRIDRHFDLAGPQDTETDMAARNDL